MLGGDMWRKGAAHTFTGLLKELHSLAQRGGGRQGGQDLYRRLAGLLERDPGLARLLGRRDVAVLVALLEREPRAWPWLGPAAAAALMADQGDEGRRAWLSEAQAALLARGAADNLLQGASPALAADLYLLRACVARPTVGDVVVVVNTARALLKQGEEQGWVGNGGPLLAALELLHEWRRPLVAALPGWGESLQRWLLLLAHEPRALPLLDSALLLLRDHLEEAPPQHAAPWLDTLLEATGAVHEAWRWAAAPALLVALSSATTSLTTTLLALVQALPHQLPPLQLRAALTPLFTLLDERGLPGTCQLPGDTLQAVTTAACRLMALAEPPLLLWAANSFQTPGRVLQAVEEALQGGEDPVVVEEARLVTAAVRALTPFSLRVLLLALRRLGEASAVGAGEAPLLAVVAEWFCAVVGSGLRLDPAACLLPPQGTPLLQVVEQHFRRQHAAPLLQVAAFALLGGDTAGPEARNFGESLAQEAERVQDAATRGACMLLAFLCCPRPVFMQTLSTRSPGQVQADVAACLHAAAPHPRYRELLAALATQIASLLPRGTHDDPPSHTLTH
ncbi:hypothetical protein E2C01_045570 [Portunus trituberculatus]|uniref:Uncharacterized protein n=1 Tax=Portunus trituberculatus TaxID=210409 RepID=A0A5B7G3H4_PORTR|nr:hypothetical protein [Portunus trituberculatus]